MKTSISKDKGGFNCIVLSDEPNLRSFLDGIAGKSIQFSYFDENFSFFRALEKSAWDIVAIDSNLWSYLPPDTRERLYAYRKLHFENDLTRFIYIQSEDGLKPKLLHSNCFYLQPHSTDEREETVLGAKKPELLFDYVFILALGELHFQLILQRILDEISLLAVTSLAKFFSSVDNPFPLLQGESEDAAQLVQQFDVARHSSRPVFISGSPGSLSKDLAFLIYLWKTIPGHFFMEIQASRHQPNQFAIRLLRNASVKTIFLQVPSDLRAEDWQGWINLSEELQTESIKIIFAMESSSQNALNRARKRLTSFDQIHIPSLTERIFDLPIILDRFLKDLSKESPMEVSNSVIQNLLNNKWPFNYAQLKNILVSWPQINRRKVHLPDLPSNMITHVRGWHELFRTLPFPREGISFERIEKELLIRTLKESNYSISKAARLINIGRKAFQYRLEKYGISSEPPEKQKQT